MFFGYGFDFGMVGYLVLIVVVWFFSGGGGAKIFFLGGNFGGDKLGFVAKFWWKVGVGFLEGKRGKDR